jgi:hypothetical protein
VNFRRTSLAVSLAALIALTAAAAGFAQVSPSPAPTGASPAPSASESGRPTRGRRAPRPAPSGSPSPEPSDTPEPPQYTSLDGSWEIEIQPPLRRLADYSYMTIVSSGGKLTGTWIHGPKRTHSAMTGTFDGRLIAMTVTLADGSSATFDGYAGNFDNMVGMYRTSEKDPGLAFTGQHRKKQRDLGR